MRIDAIAVVGLIAIALAAALWAALTGGSRRRRSDAAPQGHTANPMRFGVLIVLLLVVSAVGVWLALQPRLTVQSAGGLRLDAPAPFDAGRDIRDEVPEDVRPTVPYCRLYSSQRKGMLVEVLVSDHTDAIAISLAQSVEQWLDAHVGLIVGEVRKEEQQHIMVGDVTAKLGRCTVVGANEQLTLRVMMFEKGMRTWTVGCLGWTGVPQEQCDQVIKSVRFEDP